MMKRWQILSGSWLKLLAVATMLVDHLAAFYWQADPAFQAVWFTIGHRQITPLFIMRAIGRVAFPLFAFLLVEGFVHTRSRFRYGRNLLLYVLRDQRILQAIIGCCILPGKWIAGAAFIPISLYNGQRGFVKGKFAKYLFYAFYPLHLLVIYLLR